MYQIRLELEALSDSSDHSYLKVTDSAGHRWRYFRNSQLGS